MPIEVLVEKIMTAILPNKFIDHNTCSINPLYINIFYTLYASLY